MKTEQQLRDEIARLKKLYTEESVSAKEPVSAKVAALEWVIASSQDQS